MRKSEEVMRQPTPNILDDVLSAPKPPTMLSVEAIRVDGGTQMRSALNDETVDEYAQAFRDARSWGKFPPVVVFYDGADYWLADGFHRVAAWKKSGNALLGMRLPAEVRSGTRRDAILCAAGANANHGLRRTNADKRRAVEVLLRDEEWGKWSDREIARQCNVSADLVGAMRKQLHLSESTDTPVERTVQRNGTTYIQNTANIGNSRRYKSGLSALDMPMPRKEQVEAAVATAVERLVGERRASKALAEPIVLPDERIGQAQRLIALYRQAIASEEEYGALTGCFSDWLAPKRGLQQCVARLQRMVDLLEGRAVEPLEPRD